MTALIGLLMFSFIWVPVVVAACIAYDLPEGKRPLQALRERCVLAAGLLTLLAELVGLYALLRGVSPLRAWLGMFRGATSYQSLGRWCLAVLAALPLAAAVGCAVRYVFSARRARRRRLEPISRRKRALLMLTAVSAAGVLILGAYYGFNGASHLRLQEICREQNTLGSAGSGEDEAYVVLENTGALPVETGGMQLQSDSDERACALAQKTIAPGAAAEFRMRKDAFVDIRKSGGSTVRLVTATGAETDAVVLPEMPDDTAWRRTADGWERCLLATAAVTEATAALPAPTASAPGGFYEEAFSLTLSAPEGCAIYYTLDGSVPTAASEPYTGPIRVYDRSAEPNRFRAVQNVREDYLSHHAIGAEPVDKAFVLRAVAVDESGAQSPILTETYFVAQEAYRDRTVVSLVADPEDLFGDDGIYVTGAAYEQWYAAKRAAEAAGEPFSEPEPQPNFLQHGAAWERDANFEVYQAGTPVLNQQAGVRVQGNTSRLGVLKRFAVFSRPQYSGSRLFAAPLFPDKQTHSVVLRDGFDNAFSNALVLGRDVAAVESLPVSVFLNGEFWYDTYLQEKYSATFFAEAYGVAKDDVEYIRIGDWSNNTAEEKSAYTALLNAFTARDLSDDAAYAALCETVDIQSYIDYACVNVYLGNCDSNEKMNTCVWRTLTDEFTPYGDGRWRWALSDMDLKRANAAELHGVRTAQVNTFSQGAHEDLKRFPPLLTGGTVWEALKASPAFRQQFVLTFMDLVNTTFAVDRVEAQLAAWGQDLSYDDWFFRDRAGFITAYMEQELGLAGTQETLTITADAPDCGVVRLNTITPELSGGSWSGSYYTDYPVTLTAEPAAGHVFVGWDIDGQRVTDPTVVVPIRRGGSSVHVIFE